MRHGAVQDSAHCVFELGAVRDLGGVRDVAEASAVGLFVGVLALGAIRDLDGVRDVAEGRREQCRNVDLVRDPDAGEGVNLDLGAGAGGEVDALGAVGVRARAGR